jgi:hypothetical protein
VTHLQKDYGSQVARLLWAAQRTAAMEDLADRQNRERLALTHANAMEWLPWLERQAALGNEAAIAALRGLRYRAQRDKNKHKAGIEGEDLGPSILWQSSQTASGARYDPTTLTSAPPSSGSRQSTALNTLTPLARYDSPTVDHASIWRKKTTHKPCVQACYWPRKNMAAKYSSPGHWHFGNGCKGSLADGY